MRRPVGVKSILCCFLWTRVFLPPSGHCRHASIRTLDERFASLGASWVFSFQPVLPPDYRPRFHLEDESWARRLTQSPELGFRLWFFLAQSVFGFMQPLASLFAGYCATVRKPLRSPTGDAVRRPAFAPLQSWLVSSRSCRRARPASNPSGVDRCPLQTAPGCDALPAPAGFEDTDRLPC
jgi:hypothetical protein